MECPICYEIVNNDGDMIRLNCRHSLCHRCIRKLEKQVCPYCRIDIAIQISSMFCKPLPKKEHSVYISQIRVRARRRKRRPKSERLELENKTIVLETNEWSNSSARRGEKTLTRAFTTGCSDRKKQKHRQLRSGKWLGMNRRNFSRRN